jgi:hypothetical protein
MPHCFGGALLRSGFLAGMRAGRVDYNEWGRVLRQRPLQMPEDGYVSKRSLYS